MKTQQAKKRQHGGPRLGRGQIDAAFEKAQVQEEYLLELHRLVIPDWERVVRLEDHVRCSPELWHYLCEKAMAFDRQKHPEALPGGLWLNYGFGADESLAGDEILPPEVRYEGGDPEPVQPPARQALPEGADLIRHPECWPHVWVLPVTRRGGDPVWDDDDLGVVVTELPSGAGGVRPVVYLCNLWDAFSHAALGDPGRVRKKEYADLDALCAEWEAD